MSHYSAKEFESFIKSIIEFMLVVEHVSVGDATAQILVSYPYLRTDIATMWVTDVAYGSDDRDDTTEQAERQSEAEAQRRMKNRAFDAKGRITGW